MLRVLLIGGCLLLPALSFGQAGKAKTQEINITEGDVIESGGLKPDVGDVSIRKGASFRALIQLREDFKDKVVASVSEL